MRVAMFESGQVGKDAPCLVGLYDTLDEAKRIAPTYTGVVIADFETGKVFQREYRREEFTELHAGDAIGIYP